MAAEPQEKAELDAAFSELYKAHLRDVYSYSYYRVGNHHDAEDLTEQTFLQAYRHFERAQRESQGRPLRPWLIRIAHNLAANYYRDRSRKPQTQLEDAAIVSEPHPTAELADWELGTMRDPRNWGRTAAAGMVLAAAGGTLVLVRARQQQKRRNAGPLKALEHSIEDVSSDIRKRLGR